MSDARTLERLDRCAALINSPVAGEAEAARAAYDRIASAAGLPLWNAAPAQLPGGEAMDLQETLFGMGFWLDYHANGYWLYDPDNSALVRGGELADVIMAVSVGPVRIEG